MTEDESSEFEYRSTEYTPWEKKKGQANKHGQRGGSCGTKAKELTFVSSEFQEGQIVEAIYIQS